MSRVITAFAAAFALFMPVGRSLLVGLTPAIGIGAGLLTTQAAYAQSATDLLNAGVAKAESGNLKGAIADWTKAIELYPQYAFAYYNRGKAKRHLDDYEGAISDYSKAISLDPNFSRAYTNRGVILDVVGDVKGACKDWKKAVDLGDTSPIEWIRNRC